MARLSWRGEIRCIRARRISNPSVVHVRLARKGAWTSLLSLPSRYSRPFLQGLSHLRGIVVGYPNDMLLQDLQCHREILGPRCRAFSKRTRSMRDRGKIDFFLSGPITFSVHQALCSPPTIFERKIVGAWSGHRCE